MGRLDELDLTLALTRKDEARELDLAWERLSELRLTLGGLIGDQGIGPPVCVLF
jgi:AMP-polyphosphate phosphotransferase